MNSRNPPPLYILQKKIENKQREKLRIKEVKDQSLSTPFKNILIYELTIPKKTHEKQPKGIGEFIHRKYPPIIIIWTQTVSIRDFDKYCTDNLNSPTYVDYKQLLDTLYLKKFFKTGIIIKIYYDVERVEYSTKVNSNISSFSGNTLITKENSNTSITKKNSNTSNTKIILSKFGFKKDEHKKNYILCGFELKYNGIPYTLLIHNSLNTEITNNIRQYFVHRENYLIYILGKKSLMIPSSMFPSTPIMYPQVKDIENVRATCNLEYQKEKIAIEKEQKRQLNEQERKNILQNEEKKYNKKKSNNRVGIGYWGHS